MPVVTRSQKKNVSENETTSDKFIHKMRGLLTNCQEEDGKENKMKIGLEIYQMFNQEMNRIIHLEGIAKWINFLRMILYKNNKFRTEYQYGLWDEFNKKLVKMFLSELDKAEAFTVNIITNYDNQSSLSVEQSAPQKKCQHGDFKNDENKMSLAVSRPRRSIKSVNYTGM